MDFIASLIYRKLILVIGNQLQKPTFFRNPIVAVTYLA